MTNSIKKTFLSGTFWTFSENVIFAVVGIIQLSITSRVLSPVDFGIYAIALFFSGIGRIAFSMGLGPALIQKKKDVTHYLDTAWSANLLVSIIATIVLWLVAVPICVYYYHSPESIWPSIVIMLSVILSAAINPEIIILQKEIKLKKYFLLFILPKLVSFILVVVCVLYFQNFWALIIALLSEYFIRTIYSFILMPHKIRFHIDKAQFKELYAFGGWLQLKNVTQWLAGNIDVAIVGNMLGTAQLGIYNRAQQLSQYPKTFVDGVVNNVAFPLYSKINDDTQKLNSVVNKIIDIILLVLSYLAIVILLYAGSIVIIILGDTWVEMINPFKVIFIAYLMQTILFSFNPLIRSYGYTKNEFKFYIIKIAVMTLLLYPFTKMWGLVGAGLAILLAVILVFPYLVHILRTKTALKLHHIYLSFLCCVITVLITYFSCSFLNLDNGWLFLVGCVVSASVATILFLIIHFLFGIGPGGIIYDAILTVKKRLV